MMKQSLKIKETGSFINYLMGNNSTLPVVGKGATELSHTDRHAWEVIEVSKDGKKVRLQRYNAIRTDGLGMSEHQEYRYELIPNHFMDIVWYRGGWKIKTSRNFFLQDWYDNATVAERDACYDNNADLMLIDGKTYKKTEYHKIHIIFGVLQEYYDFSF